MRNAAANLFNWERRPRSHTQEINVIKVGNADIQRDCVRRHMSGCTRVLSYFLNENRVLNHFLFKKIDNSFIIRELYCVGF
jgi:hypothetical protein